MPLGSPGWCTILSTNRPSVQSVQSIPSIQSVKSVVSVRPNRPSNPSSAGPPKMSNVRSFPNTYLKKQLSQKSKSRTGFGPKMSAISSSGAVNKMGESSRPEIQFFAVPSPETCYFHEFFRFPLPGNVRKFSTFLRQLSSNHGNRNFQWSPPRDMNHETRCPTHQISRHGHPESPHPGVLMELAKMTPAREPQTMFLE